VEVETPIEQVKSAVGATAGNGAGDAGRPRHLQEGKVYPLREPKALVRFQGQAPIAITVYELERVRCNLRREIHTAESPAGVGDEKYDPESASMTGDSRSDVEGGTG
jgi:hypothetical protein